MSPLCLPQSYSQRKSSVTSVLSIDDFVEDAARQFDQLTDGEDFDVNDESEPDERTRLISISISFSSFKKSRPISELCTTLSRTGAVRPSLSTP